MYLIFIFSIIQQISNIFNALQQNDEIANNYQKFSGDNIFPNMNWILMITRIFKLIFKTIFIYLFSII